MNRPTRAPPIFDARCRACWFGALLLGLIVLSFWSLNLDWRAFFSVEAGESMLRFIREFFPPDLSTVFLAKVWVGALETFAMSLLGTILAVAMGIFIALPASTLHRNDDAQNHGQYGAKQRHGKRFHCTNPYFGEEHR